MVRPIPDISRYNLGFVLAKFPLEFAIFFSVLARFYKMVPRCLTSMPHIPGSTTFQSNCFGFFIQHHCPDSGFERRRTVLNGIPAWLPLQTGPFNNVKSVFSLQASSERPCRNVGKEERFSATHCDKMAILDFPLG